MFFPVLGAFPAPLGPETGLSAPTKNPLTPGSEVYVREPVHGHKLRKPKTEGFWFRFYPLRWRETTSMYFHAFEFLQSKNSCIHHSRPP
jgi:hypothetical protein